MHGKILNWNGAASSGVVVTEGGERYAFGPTDFKSAAQPRAGLKVDFVPEGERAGEIYVTDDGVLGGADGAGSNAMLIAIIAIVCAILGFLIPGLGLILAIAALLLGLRARKLGAQDANGTARVLATVSVIGGVISVFVALLVLLFVGGSFMSLMAL